MRKAEAGDETTLAYIQTESWKSAFAQILSPEELTQSTDLKKAETMYQKVLERNIVSMTIESVDGQPTASPDGAKTETIWATISQN